LKFSLCPQDWSNWKARITERLVEYYIQKEVIPSLQEEGWSDAMYSAGWFYYPIRDSRGDILEMGEKLEAKCLISNGLFPTSEFLRKFQKLTQLLENVPDGFLIKWKETNRLKPLKEALTDLRLDKSHWEYGSFQARFNSRREYIGGRLKEQITNKPTSIEEQILPVANGEVETIEVKSGKSWKYTLQKESYSNILREGYVLRLYLVKIVCFEKNDFEIEEKVLSSPIELGLLLNSTGKQN
jgi:hypothetical protein